MKSILEQLYNGEIYPYSTFKTTIEQFKVDRGKAFETYSLFLEKLPEDLKDDFVKLIDAHLDLLPLELEQNFIDGFRIVRSYDVGSFLCPFRGTKYITEIRQSPNSTFWRLPHSTNIFLPCHAIDLLKLPFYKAFRASKSLKRYFIPLFTKWTSIA